MELNYWPLPVHGNFIFRTEMSLVKATIDRGKDCINQ